MNVHQLKMAARKNWKKYEISLYALEEDQKPDFEDPRDNAFAVNGLAKGNQWAWCTAKVVVRCPHTGICEADYLGGCAYHSREDFMRPGGYYDDMVNGCIQKIEEEKSRLREALKHC